MHGGNQAYPRRMPDTPAKIAVVIVRHLIVFAGVPRELAGCEAGLDQLSNRLRPEDGGRGVSTLIVAV